MASASKAKKLNAPAVAPAVVTGVVVGASVVVGRFEPEEPETVTPASALRFVSQVVVVAAVFTFDCGAPLWTARTITMLVVEAVSEVMQMGPLNRARRSFSIAVQYTSWELVVGNVPVIVIVGVVPSGLEQTQICSALIVHVLGFVVALPLYLQVE
jgi:hypothetical protein